MNRNKEWLVPLTGVGFLVLGVVSFLVAGEPSGPPLRAQADRVARQLSRFCEYHLPHVDIPRQESGLAIGEVVFPQPPETVVEA